MPQCAFKSCKNNYRKSNLSVGVSYFRFPCNPFTSAEWTSIVARERRDDFYKPAKNSVICSDHFDKVDITGNTNRQRLVKNAIPKLQIQPASEDLQLMTPNIQLLESDTDDVMMVNPSATPAAVEVQVVDPQHDDGKASGHADPTASELSCFACGVGLSNKIYKCVECENFTMCGDCEQDNLHPHHCVLRIPSQPIYNALRSLFASLQKEVNEKLSVKRDNEDPFQLGHSGMSYIDADAQDSDFDSNESSWTQGDVEMKMLEIKVPVAKPKAKEKQVAKVSKADDEKVKSTSTHDSKLKAPKTGASKVKATSTKDIKGKVVKRTISHTTTSVQAYKKIALDTLESKETEGKSKELKSSSELVTNLPLEPEIYVAGATTVVTHDTGDPLLIKDEIKEEPEDAEIDRIENPGDCHEIKADS